jgi:hypothetical protein
MSRLVLVLALYFSSTLYPATINQTAVQICSADFIASQNSTNFYQCMQGVEIQNKRPLSCYQAEAAATCFQTAVQVSSAIFAASVLAAIMPTLINWIWSAKCCNTGCTTTEVAEQVNDDGGAPLGPTPKEIAIDIEPMIASTPTNMDFLKKVSSATFGQITAYFSIAISFASANQLFALWQAWTVAEANCAFDSTQS